MDQQLTPIVSVTGNAHFDALKPWLERWFGKESIEPVLQPGALEPSHKLIVAHLRERTSGPYIRFLFGASNWRQAKSRIRTYLCGGFAQTPKGCWPPSVELVLDLRDLDIDMIGSEPVNGLRRQMLDAGYDDLGQRAGNLYHGGSADNYSYPRKEWAKAVTAGAVPVDWFGDVSAQRISDAYHEVLEQEYLDSIEDW